MSVGIFLYPIYMKKKIIDGYRVSYIEAVKMLNEYSDTELYSLADDLRNHFQGKKISTCMIMNAKSGACTENCKWCSQSKFHNTGVSVYPLVDYNQTLKDAQNAEKEGVERFGLVTSGRSVSQREVDQLVHIYRGLKKSTPKLNLCSSLGLISKDKLQKLYDAGVRRYHCNIETAPSYFEKLCTTHSIEEKIETIKAAQEVGMSICSGGIISMGETMEQRIEMAVLLQKLNIDSIPVNLLQPIPNTPLAEVLPLEDTEILRSFAMFKIINPRADVRLAGGRVRIKHIQKEALKSGISGALVGDMLTTIGSKVKEDFETFNQLGYTI